MGGLTLRAAKNVLACSIVLSLPAACGEESAATGEGDTTEQGDDTESQGVNDETTPEMGDETASDAVSQSDAADPPGASDPNASEQGETSEPSDAAEVSGTADRDAATPGQATPSSDGGSAEAPAVSKENIGNVVFDESEVRSYYLTLSDEEYAKLMDMSTLLRAPTVVNEDRYVNASLEMGDTKLPSIALRFKGQFSLYGCIDGGMRTMRVESYYRDIDVCQRFSLKLDFNRNEADARLDGLKALNLHAMAADPSKLRERLGYSLYREMNVLVPRAVHARVYINGEYHGLFAAVEEVDGRFTANRFPDSGDGNVYKEIWPAAHVTSTAAAEALRTNDDPATLDVSDFEAFRDAVGVATEADPRGTLSPYVDLDYLARFIVVNRAINDFDGALAFYFGWGPPPANHNLYWYHDTESGQFVLIPWDLDKSFWYPEPNFWSDNEPNGMNVTPNWNVVTNNCDGYTAWFDNLGQSYQMMNIDCDPLLKLVRNEIYADQAAITEEFLAGPFSEESVRAKVDAWRVQLADAVEEDPLMDSTHWQDSVDALLADLPNFHANVSLMMNGLIDE
jgi:hypothetical protein